MAKNKLKAVPILSVPSATAMLIVLAISGGFGATRINLLEDITALLPDRDEDRSSLVGLARDWGLMRKIVVVLGPGKPSSERLHLTIDILADDLAKVRGVRQVMAQVDMASVRQAAEAVTAHATRLYRPNRILLGQKEIKGRLAELKKRLAAPEAMVMQPYLLGDPLGLANEALKSLESAGKAMGATLEQGHLFSRDLKYALLVVELDFDPFEVDKATGFLERFEKTIPKTLARADAGDLNVTALGGITFAVSNAQAIRSDIWMAFTLTVVFVVAIFAVFFRRIRMLPAALLPGGAGIAAAIFVMSLLGEPLHALTLGFAATITGISVDYAIHLLLRATRETGTTSLERMASALGFVTRPVVLGCLTTFLAFVLVAMSNFTGLKQLALFAAISIPVSMLVTIFVLPAFHGWLLPSVSRGSTATGSRHGANPLLGTHPARHWRVPIVAVACCLTGVSLFYSTQLPMSGDPRDLGYVDADLASKETLVQNRFPGLFDQALLVTRGQTQEEALSLNDSLYEKLLKSDFSASNVISLSPFLPSLRTQQESLNAVKEIFDKKSKGSSTLFKEAGFSSSYFASLKEKTHVAPITPETFENSALEQMVNQSLKSFGEDFFVLTRVRAGDDAQIDKLLEIATGMPKCRLISERLETQSVLTMLQQEIVWMLAIWLTAALLLLSLSHRSIWFGLKAALPAVFGVLMVMGLFSLLKRPLTPVASAGITLVMGLGIDYGIFMQQNKHPKDYHVALAVLASALTTIAAFGVLALAETRAMADLGLIILVGVAGALVAALLLLPVLSRHAWTRKKA